MDNKEQHIDFYELTAKYLAGEASENEVKLLEDQVRTDPEKESMFREYKQAWMLTRSTRADFDKKQVWNDLEEQLFREEDQAPAIPIQSQQSQWSMVYRIAASITILAAIGFVLFYFIQPGQTELTAMNDVVTEVLEDGSEVSINRNSTLTYSGKYNQDERNVTLEGDAFFDVARDENKPFIIKTSEVTIKVLGTSFYVDARHDSPEIKVIVNSGRVEVLSEQAERIELAAGESGTFNKRENRLVKVKNKDKNYLAWKTKRMVFENTPLAEVVDVIQKTYSVNIQLSSTGIGECELTSTFNRLDLEDIFEILTETFPNLEISKSVNVYLIRGTKCEQ